MSNCVQHIQCPKCANQGKDRSENNLAIYSDGSVFCFSCGFYKTKNKHTIIKKQNRLPRSRSIILPTDVTKIFSDKYLSPYNITKRDQERHNIFWSEQYKRIIFTIWDKENLIAYTGKYFGNNPTKPKWYSQGINPNLLHIIGKPWSNTLVLTEDIISAIRVSHLPVQTMPIFGSHISTYLWLRLKYIPNINKIILWLDKDKEKESIKYSYSGRQLGLPVYSLITEKDPKNIEEKEIQKLLDIDYELC